MKKKTNDNLKNKYLLIGLSVFCVALIVAVLFGRMMRSAPVRQVKRICDYTDSEGNQRVRLVAVRPYR